MLMAAVVAVVSPWVICLTGATAVFFANSSNQWLADVEWSAALKVGSRVWMMGYGVPFGEVTVIPLLLVVGYAAFGAWAIGVWRPPSPAGAWYFIPEYMLVTLIVASAARVPVLPVTGYALPVALLAVFFSFYRDRTRNPNPERFPANGAANSDSKHTEGSPKKTRHPKQSRPSRLARWRSRRIAAWTRARALNERIKQYFSGGYHHALREASVLAGLGAEPYRCRVYLRGRPHEIPVWLVAGFQAAVRAALSLLAVGAVTVLLWALVRAKPVAEIFDLLGTGVFGTLLIWVLQLGYLPNLAAMALAWLSGAGFTLGSDSHYSVLATEPGPIPAVPLLAAIPESAPVWPLLAVPPVAGAVLGALIYRRYAQPLFSTHLLTAITVIVSGFVLFVAGFWFAGGALGRERLTYVGAPVLPAASLLAAEVLLPLAIVFVLSHPKMLGGKGNIQPSQSPTVNAQPPRTNVDSTTVSISTVEIEKPQQTKPQQTPTTGLMKVRFQQLYTQQKVATAPTEQLTANSRNDTVSDTAEHEQSQEEQND